MEENRLHHHFHLPTAGGLRHHFTAIHWDQLARRWLPVTNWLFNYRIADLPYDLIAGITVGLTLVPQCLSYAALCNVRSEFGLYTSFLGQIIYFIFGTSKDGSLGPTAITSMMMGQVNAMYNPLADQGDNTYNAIITFISGIVLVAIGVLKLGFIVSLFSIPIVSGFTSAAGFVIIGSQMKLFFGLKGAPNDSPSAFVKQMKNIYDRRAEIKPYDVLCSCLCMIFLFSFQYTPLVIAKVKEFRNKGKTPQIPSRLEAKLMEILGLIIASRNAIVFIVTTGIAYGCYLQDPQLEKTLSLVGFIKPGLPTWQFPKTEIAVQRTVQITPEEASHMLNGTFIVNEVNGTITTTKTVVLKTASEIIKDLSAMIIIIPLMTMLEQFAITKALGRKNGYSVDASCELLGSGLANFFQSFIDAFPATTTISRCALNDQCKVKTQLASLISSAIVIITLAALTPLFYFIPKPTLAAIMCCAGYNLVDFNIVIHMWHDCPRDVFILLGTFCLCLFYDIAYGILIAILLSMVSFLRPIIAMSLDVRREQMKIKGFLPGGQYHNVTVVRLPHGMEYPSCDRFIEEMTSLFCTTEDRHVIVDCRFISDVDYSGLQAFRSLLMVAFKKDKHIIFTNLSEQLQERFQLCGIEHFKYVGSVEEAVEEHYWASNLTLTRVPSADAAGTHISSIVVEDVSSPGLPPVPSRARVSFAPSEMGSRADDEAAAVPTLRKPVSSRQLGTAWQQPGGLFSASFASMWTVAQLGHNDDNSVGDWYNSGTSRKIAAQQSNSKLAREKSQSSEMSSIKEMDSEGSTAERRRRVQFLQSVSAASRGSTSSEDSAIHIASASKRVPFDQSAVIQKIQEEGPEMQETGLPPVVTMSELEQKRPSLASFDMSL